MTRTTTGQGRWSGGRAIAAAMLAAAVAAAAGCGGNGGATTGTGGMTGTTTTTTSSTGTGGGGTGGATGTGGGGTGGGAACVDGAAFASLFTIADASFCAVAVYTADEAIGSTTWGTHHGPLSVVDDKNGKVDVVRWQVPAGASGKLTKMATTVDIMLPTGAFLGSQAVDLPFLGWTAVSYTGSDAPYAGKIAMIKGSAVDASYPLDGAFAVAGVGTDTAARLLYTGESALGPGGNDENALYAADTCSTGTKPDLACAATLVVSAWGEASGPIAVDGDGNVFVVMSKFSDGTQEARGFGAASAAHGAAATNGTTLFTIPGFGSSLAALAPKAGGTGLLVFQPFDPTTFAPGDVIAQKYLEGNAIAAQGMPATLLTVPAGGMTGLSLMVDDTGRLWVVGADSTTTTFVVLAPKS